MKWLPLEEWWYNTTYHTSTKMSPFEALYGYPTPSISYFLQDKSKVHAIESHMENTKETLTILKENLQMAQNRMKQQAYQHQSERQFEEGDWVFLRLQPYKQSTLKQKKNKKLAPKFYGPYKIIHRIGQVAYELDFPSSHIHKVFHVSFLKKVLGQTMPVQIELPELDEEGKLILEPEKVIDQCSLSLWNRTIMEYLIKWKNMPLEEATWENEQFMKKHPQLQALRENFF
jgi:hypothetical protein